MKRNMFVPTRVSTLALAVALTVGPSPAIAESLKGTPNVAFGSANITEGTLTTNVSIDSSQVVIDWAPDDNAVGNFGAIAFQDAGTTATFSSAGDFAVLNRVNVQDPSRIVALSGTINSLVNGQTGGSVFFYSPSGFVLTGSSVINVGSLVLSALPITVDGQGNFINNGTVTFGQATNPNAAINTVSDISGTAQINASGAGSYVALVAPTILHQGDIRTDGAAALVAAEAATITFSPSGLFDIQVTTGTDAATGIHVDGGTIGRNSATEGVFNHRAYLVAVAKNDAVTMLINNGGSIGFDTATSATVENNAVVLSGGYDIAGGGVLGSSGTSTVSLNITNASFSSDVAGRVSGGLDIDSFSGAVNFGGDLSFTSGGSALIDALNGNPLTVAGNLDISAYAEGLNNSRTGQLIRVGADNGSTLTIGGNVFLDVHSVGATGEQFGDNGGDATGGDAHIHANANSTISIAGTVDITADGFGGDINGGAVAGNGTGGRVLVMALGGNSNVTIDGPVNATADGYGGGVIFGECSVCTVTGGDGQGGEVSVHTNLAAGNLLQLNSDLSISASGYGGEGDAQAGDGLGGIAHVGAGDGSTLRVGADTYVLAYGQGGYGFEGSGGNGVGGVARITTGGAGGNLIELGGPAFVVADGEGGQGAFGGTGTGGQAYVSAVLGTIHAFNDLTVFANSIGGTAFSFNGSATGGDGIADTETTTTADITEAVLFSGAGNLTVDGQTFVAANALGGEIEFGPGSGGDAVAGSAVIHAGNRDDGTSIIRLSDVIVTADAQGGNGASGQGGTNGGDGGNGGSATAGRVIVTAAAGSGDLTAGLTILSASATGGSGGSGGNGDGGTGGNGGDGGNAIGGFINVGTESGNVNLAQAANNGVATYESIIALATADGGDGGDAGFGSPDGIAGDGGDASGGNSVLLVRGSELNVGDVTLVASATGGNGGLDTVGAPQGAGGDALSGAVGAVVTHRYLIPSQRGTLNAGSISGTAIATGGIGSVNGNQWTLGGNTFFELIGADATLDNLNLIASADGIYPDAVETYASYVQIIDGTVTVANQFDIETPGRISIHADNGTLSALLFQISADNFVHDEGRPLPIAPGSIAANNIFFTTGQDLIVDAQLTSLNGVGFTAPGLIDLENVTSTNGLVSLNAGTTANAGNLSAGLLVSVTAGSDINVGAVNAAGAQAIFNSTSGAISTGAINALTFIALDAPVGITTGNLTAGDFVFGQSDGSILTGAINAATSIDLFSTAGGVSTGNLDAGSDIFLEATGSIHFGDVVADIIDFETAGDVTGGDIIAGTSASGEAQGAISLGDINVGILQAGGPTDDGFAVGFASATSINVGDVVADEAIGFATFGDLTTGNLSAGPLIMTLVGGDIAVGAMTTTAPDGRIYMADAQMYVDAGGLVDSFNPALVLASPPLPTSGSINIGGPLTTGLLQAAAGNDFSAGAIDASLGIEVAAGGTITVSGAWAGGGDSNLVSSDIDITASGSISGGDIQLVSINGTRTVIGDGTGLTGYNISNAEYSRLDANDINVIADTSRGAAPTMIIGDLTVDGSSQDVEYDFSTGNESTGQAEGSIRILGEVRFTGMDDFDFVDFNTGTFELDAATGLLELTGAGGATAGTVEIYATHVHVAQGDILDQLAADPLYSGYQDDLNAPADVQRPDGVIRAAAINVAFGNATPGQPYTLYVQNTGSAETPAGFVITNQFGLDDGGEASLPPNSLNVVINGQIQTVDGTLTGVAVRDALVAAQEGDLAPFTANSTVNGCALTGDCAIIVDPPEPPVPPGFTPTPGIQEEIALISDNGLPPPEFGNEDFIDDNDEETDDSETSPIEPPQPLFDTSELGEAESTAGPEVGTSMRSTPGLTDTGDVDDPVSGSGNPALMETPPAPPTEEKQP